MRCRKREFGVRFSLFKAVDGSKNRLHPLVFQKPEETSRFGLMKKRKREEEEQRLSSSSHIQKNLRRYQGSRYEEGVSEEAVMKSFLITVGKGTTDQDKKDDNIRK